MGLPAHDTVVSPARLRALWFELHALRSSGPALRRACDQVAQPFTHAAVSEAREGGGRERRRALRRLELSIIRLGAYVDDLLLHAWRAHQRAARPCSTEHAWRWALAQRHGLSTERVARLERAARTARGLVRSDPVSAADLYTAARTLAEDLDSAVALVLAAWSRAS